MKKDMKESRKHPRYTKIIQMDCLVERFPEDVVGEKAKLKTGETGMLINCDFLLPERTLIKMTVNDRSFSGSKISFNARIAWTKRNAYKIFGRYAAGLHLEKGDKEDIERLVEHFN